MFNGGKYVSLAACLWSFWTGMAAAQDTGEPPAAIQRPAEFETVYTTARQRTETLQSAPVAATAFTSEMLDRYALDDLEQVATHTPNLVVNYGSSGGSASVYLRGVGTGSGSAGFESAIGLVIDGVYYSRGRYIQQGFFDLDQIEVLKGPQALYYGKNNSAGLIVIRTKNPGDEFEGYARVGYEFNAEEILTEAGISVPVSEHFGFRLALKMSDMQGWLRNLSQPIDASLDPLGNGTPGSVYGHLPREKEYQGRLTMRWTPNDNLEAVLKVGGVRNEDSGNLSKSQLIKCFGANGRPQPVFRVPSPYEDCTLDFRKSRGDISPALLVGEPDYFGDGKPFTTYKAATVGLEVNYTLDTVTLTSVTGYQHYEVASLENYSVADDAQVPGYESTDYDGFSQELRLLTSFDMPINFMLGALYSDTDVFFRSSSRVAPFAFYGVGADPATGRQFTWDKNASTAGKVWSFYGEATWNITDQLELAGGARYTRETKNSQFRLPYLHCGANILINCAGIAFVLPQEFDHHFAASNVSPQVTLTWRPNDGLTLYGAYKTGFKSGGFDLSFLPNRNATIDDLTFENEKSHGFEIGAKLALLNDTLRLNATAYRYEFTNLQVQQYNAATTTFTIDNAGKARTTGIELDADWLAADGLTVRGGIAYNRARYPDFLAACYAGQSVEAGCNVFLDGPGDTKADSQDLSGTQLALAPDWVVRLGFTYDIPLSADLTASLSVDGTYSSDYYAGLSRQPESLQKDYAILDATLRLFGADDSWDVSIIGRNLTNQKVMLSAADRALTGGASGYPSGSPQLGNRADLYAMTQRSRQVWLQLTYRFR